MEPKTEATIGEKIHCQNIEKLFQIVYFWGRGGNRMKLIYTENTKKKVAILIITRVSWGVQQGE